MSANVIRQAKRYTEDRVALPSLVLRVLGGAVVAGIFLVPYIIMFFGAVYSWVGKVCKKSF